MIAWYLSQFTVRYFDPASVVDPTTVQPGQMLPPAGVSRSYPIEEFIPFIPNPEGFTWSATEILGNYVLCKVSASDALHAQIAADSRFTQIPDRLTQATIPSNRRTAIRNKLVSLGYTATEVNATNWSVVNLLTLLTSGASPVEPDDTGRNIRILPGKIATRLWQDLDREVPV
jgi:hypothetical protein